VRFCKTYLTPKLDKMENSEEVKRMVLELLENFGIDEEGHAELVRLLNGSMLQLLNILLSIDNKNKENIGTVIAKIIGLDGCDYQIHLSLVGKEEEWQEVGGYFTTGKVFTNKSIDEIN